MSGSTETLQSPAVQDYAKAIYALEARREPGSAVPTTELAQRLGVTPGSVSQMVKRLDELELVTHVPYRGVVLTEAGRRIALEVIRHHRLLELYLVRSLGVPWDRVHDEAEVLEHVLSEQLEERIASQLGDPTHDPHGDPIPSADLVLTEGETRSLAELAPGDAGTFVRVSDSDPAKLRYLQDRGIGLGDRCEVIAREPFGGPLTVRFGAAAHALGGELTHVMRIETQR
jgi:DtxR family transcriptional regulator, Mn-dependent transcriptional regulator